jgi:hypothetical protein
MIKRGIRVRKDYLITGDAFDVNMAEVNDDNIHDFVDKLEGKQLRIN